MKKLLTTALLTLLVVGIGDAIASTELRWLNNAPARHFTEQDWRILIEHVERVLNETPDGETVEWTNEESGAHGLLTPGSTGEHDGMTCRNLEMENHARNVSATSNHEYCQRPDGSWGLLHQSARTRP
jgi:surface antigen